MQRKKYLVTGGTGFIGSALVRRLLHAGHSVRVLDNDQRGMVTRLDDIAEHIELVKADIRDAHSVYVACKGTDSVCHLAYVNGTESFYTNPELVLEIGVKGMMNVLDGCRNAGVGELILASSSEVYQTPPIIPTDESVPLSVPDPLNPRYSYGGGKIISELLALNYGRSQFERVMVFRPHNVYGPDMGWEHVIPQFAVRMRSLLDQSQDLPLDFPIQGTGDETRAFIYIDDFIDGVMLMMDKGVHLGIYHIGTMEEVSIRNIAEMIGASFGRHIHIVPGKSAQGGTVRRCPDISKIKSLGFSPEVPLEKGLAIAVQWYAENTAGVAGSTHNLL